ncbi:hypothetical protein AOLI_G00311190 [Acnodon oligacanthus]
MIFIRAHLMFSCSFPSSRLVQAAVVVRVVMSSMYARIGGSWIPFLVRSPPTTHLDALMMNSKAIMKAKEGIGRGGRVTVCTDENLDTDNPVLTITYYTKGTVLVQRSEISLDPFQENFPQLKAEVEREVASTTVDSTHSEEDGAEALPTLPTTAPPPPPSDRQLRESLALLELNFTEFKEHTQTRLSDSNINSPIQQLREEVQQLKGERQASIAELRGSLRELQQENHNL